MVGGLIQKQEIVLFQHQFGQSHPAPLAAGEGGNSLEDLLAGEQEQRQHRPHVAGLHPGKIVPHLAHDVLFRVQGGLLLVIIAHVHIGAEENLPAVRLLQAADQVQQGGLAHAVWADHRHPVAGAQMQVQPGKQCPAAEALFQIFHHQHVVAAAPPGAEGKAHLLFADGLFHPFDFVQLLFPAFRGPDGAFGVIHAIAGDDGLLPGDFRLLHFIFLQPPLQIGLALLGELIVIALVLIDAPHAHLGHAVAHAVHEIPVVGDDHDAAPIFPQGILQPLGGGQIQMVGGLVQHQKLRLGQQKPRQAQPGLFAAGEQRRLLAALIVGKAQARQHALNAAGPFVAPRVLEPVHQPGIIPGKLGEGLRVVMQRRHLLFHFPQAGFHAPHGFEHPLQFLLHGVIRGNVRLLGEHAHPRALKEGNGARIRLQFSGDHAKEGGLSRAVDPHHAHALAGLQNQAGVLQHRTGDKGLGYVIDGEQDHTFSPCQRPDAPQGSTPPAVTGSTISSAATLPPRCFFTVMVSILFKTAGCRPVV